LYFAIQTDGSQVTQAMPAYKLYYFDVRGRGELIRMIFAAANQKYEDVRIKFEEWPKKKGEFHFGQLPVLEIDGERYNQSVAIAHYLAQQFGLAGKTPLDALKCHSIVETLNDASAPITSKMNPKVDDAAKAAVIKEAEPAIKEWLAKLEECCKSHSSGGFAVAGQLTYADLAMHNRGFQLLQYYGPDFLKAYPTLQKHYEMVNNHPKIKEYLANRPASKM
jgi:glutathione S-transferase